MTTAQAEEGNASVLSHSQEVWVLGAGWDGVEDFGGFSRGVIGAYGML